MKQKNAIHIFEDKKVRTLWDADQEKWYIAIADVIAALTDSPNPQVYWRVLKKRLKAEGNETVTNCNGLKMLAPDGKMRMTDVADTEQLFRLIQSIPSPKAEPFKLWLAQVASERLDEMQDPELSIDRACLKKENLRDNMTNTELILNMLAEASTKDISAATNPKDFEQSKKVAKQGGNVAKVARKELEAKTGKKVVTSLSAKGLLKEKEAPKKLKPKK